MAQQSRLELGLRLSSRPDSHIACNARYYSVLGEFRRNLKRIVLKKSGIVPDRQSLRELITLLASNETNSTRIKLVFNRARLQRGELLSLKTVAEGAKGNVDRLVQRKDRGHILGDSRVRDFLEKLSLVFMLILHWPTATPQTLWARMLRKVRAPSQASRLRCSA